MYIKTSKILLSIVSFALIISCSHDPQQSKITNSPSSTPATPASEPLGTPASEPSPKPTPSTLEANIEPISIPSDYQMIEATFYRLAIPADWTYEQRSTDMYTFIKDEKKIGESEILGWFDSSSWHDMKPNHSEQIQFIEVDDLVTIHDLNVHTYKIELTHTKPAADEEADWKLQEMRWYVTVKEQERSYGFYFSSDDVDEATMKSVLSTFQLK